MTTAIQSIQKTNSATSVNPPIVVEFAGGLGNQLFQYAFAQFLHGQLDGDTKRTIYFDATSVYRDHKRNLNISEFDIDNASIIQSRRTLFAVLKERIHTSLSTVEKVVHKLHPYKNPLTSDRILVIDDDILSKSFFENHKDVSQYAEHIVELIKAHSDKPVFVRGYWQYAWVIQQNLNVNVPMPAPKDPPSQRVQDEISFIAQKSSTCSLHIRRGDYLQAEVKSALPPLSIEYYKQAISRVLQKDGSTTCYVFSDDIPWCKEHLPTLLSHVLDSKQLVFASEHISRQETEDLLLMNACKHHIMANSSFSWWGTVLGGQHTTNSVHIAPKTWFADERKNASIKMKGWIVL